MKLSSHGLTQPICCRRADGNLNNGRRRVRKRNMAPISVLDFREELDYGLTDDFQIALYLNHHYVDANDEVER